MVVYIFSSQFQSRCLEGDATKHFFTLFQNFCPRISLKINAFLRENKKKKTKPFSPGFS